MKKIKILIIIKQFADKWPKHKHKYDMITAVEEFAEVKYWHTSGDIINILKDIKFIPDFILHYDIEWNYSYSPLITGLDKVNIPKGFYILDIHYSKKNRIKYFGKNKIDLIFSASRSPFLNVFPQYKDEFRWMPFSINTNIIKDWGLNKDIDYLLMGQFYYKDKINPPKRLPPKGRYIFREFVYSKMKEKKEFIFHPHPGHYALPSKDLIVNEKYAQELNRSKMFFTCGSIFKAPVAKFFEAPGCKTLLLAKPNKDIFNLGFKDGVNFVACDEFDFYDKAMYYIRNKKERERITNNGYKLIHNYHTNRVRAQQFIKYIDDFLCNK